VKDFTGYPGIYKKMSSIDQQILRRLKRAMGTDIAAVVEVLDYVVPIIEKEVQSDEYAVELAECITRLSNELKRYIHTGQDEKNVLLGKMREVEPILHTSKYELANLVTLEEGRQEFIRADVPTIKTILELFDRQPRRDALYLLSAEQFQHYQEDVGIVAEKRAALE
jgi:hypothetical protein